MIGQIFMTDREKKTGKALERRVAQYYRDMGAASVEHDVDVAGSQIDVLAEWKMPDGGRHRLAVEVKDHNTPVGIRIVNDFSLIAKRLRESHDIEEGVIVSSAGFTRPARRAADSSSVRLREIADLAKAAKTVDLDLQFEDGTHSLELSGSIGYDASLESRTVCLNLQIANLGEITGREIDCWLKFPSNALIRTEAEIKSYITRKVGTKFFSEDELDRFHVVNENQPASQRHVEWFTAAAWEFATFKSLVGSLRHLPVEKVARASLGHGAPAYNVRRLRRRSVSPLESLYVIFQPGFESLDFKVDFRLTTDTGETSGVLAIVGAGKC